MVFSAIGRNSRRTIQAVNHQQRGSVEEQLDRLIHAGQRIQSRAPIFAGDQVTASSHLKEVYPKTGRSGTMVFIVWETTFRNQHGDVVADVQESYAARE